MARLYPSSTYSDKLTQAITTEIKKPAYAQLPHAEAVVEAVKELKTTQPSVFDPNHPGDKLALFLTADL